MAGGSPDKLCFRELPKVLEAGRNIYVKITKLDLQSIGSSPGLHIFVFPCYQNDPIYVKNLGLILKTRGSLFLTFILYFVGVVMGVICLLSFKL